MNTDYVVRNLEEATEALRKAIEAAKADDFGPFMVSIVLTYRKLNRAWNSYNLSDAEILSQTNEQHELRCRFPTDLAEQISD